MFFFELWLPIMPYICSLILQKNKTMEFELRENDEYIQLTQLLKAVGIAENGAMAGQMVLDGLVKLNGERESRKRAKLRSGDVVSVMGNEIRIK